MMQQLADVANAPGVPELRIRRQNRQNERLERRAAEHQARRDRAAALRAREDALLAGPEDLNDL